MTATIVTPSVALHANKVLRKLRRRKHAYAKTRSYPYLTMPRMVRSNMFLSTERTTNCTLCKTSVEQMRAVVRKAKKDKPAVLPADKQSSGVQPDLSQDQMRLFTAWLKESNGGEQVTMLTTGDDLVFETDPARIAEGFSMLTPCLFCFVSHTPQNPWCALSMGMPDQCPSPDTSAGCTRSQCNTRCACDMRAYDKEFQARTRARVDLFNSQVESHDSRH